MCNLIFNMLFPIKTLSIIGKRIMEQISVTVILSHFFCMFYNQLSKTAYTLASCVEMHKDKMEGSCLHSQLQLYFRLKK